MRRTPSSTVFFVFPGWTKNSRYGKISPQNFSKIGEQTK
jgi:hypothetical protein